VVLPAWACPYGRARMEVSARACPHGPARMGVAFTCFPGYLNQKA
jgi:hypothetical protein